MASSRKWIVPAVMLAACGAALVFGLLLLNASLARHRFEADVAARRAQGERVLKADFAYRPVPAEANAAHFINDAGSAIRVSEDDFSFYFNLPSDRGLNSLEMERVRVILQANNAAFESARHARSCPEVDWQLDLSPSPLIGKLQLRYLNPTRELAQLIALKARFEHQRGDDAEAVESLRDLLFLSRAVNAQSVAVSHLVSLGLMSVATEACRNVAADLQVTIGAAKRGSAATRYQVDQLIADLVEGINDPRASVEAWEGERMEALDSVLFVAQTASIFRRGEVYVQADRVLREGNILLAAVQAPNWPAYKAKVGASPPPGADAIQNLSHMLCSRWREIPVFEFRSRAERGAAALALAIRLFAIDHGNGLPASLDVLAPTYLKSLPSDPFTAAAAPLRYRSTAPAAVYSVSQDGVDDGGDVDPARANNWAGPDGVFPLHSGWQN